MIPCAAASNVADPTAACLPSAAPSLFEGKPALQGAAPSAVAQRIASLGSIARVLFVDLENAAPFFLNVAVGAARRNASAGPGAAAALCASTFVWIFATAGQTTALHASKPLRSLFDSGRVAFSVCDGRGGPGGAPVPDALDAFLAASVALLSRLAPPSVAFSLVTGDRARGPMQEVIERHRGGPRAVSRVAPQSFTLAGAPSAAFFEDAGGGGGGGGGSSGGGGDAAAPRPALGLLQRGLGELWLAVRGRADFVEGAELRRSAQRFKKGCAAEYRAKSVPFSLQLAAPDGVGAGGA